MAGPADAPGRARRACVSAGRLVQVSADGELAVIDRDDAGLEIRDVRLCEIAELLSRPLASARPADLAAVRAAEARGVRTQALEAVRLLRACLEHRFGTDVATGGTQQAGGAMDIALRASGEWP